MQLAGLCRVEDAIPRMLRMFDYDWDWWNELIQANLIKMGSPAALQASLDSYPTQPWHGRLYLSGVLEHLRIEPKHRDIIGLLKKEAEDDLRVGLAVALASYGNSESMVHARAVYDEYPPDPERFHIAEILYAFHTIMGERGATLEEWRERQEDQRRRQESAKERLAHLAPAGPSPRKAAGRNDPCPCGSGRKFKKCCLPKLEAQAKN